MQLVKVDELPEGAVPIHLGFVQTVWRPRGSLNKNSVSADLVERLQALQDSWTDPEYGDCLDPAEAAVVLTEGLREEVEIAITEFLSTVF